MTQPPLGYSLGGELVGPHRDAVDELHGTPEPVELHALVDVHDAIGGWRAPPDGVLQVAPNARQDDLKHGQATAQALLGQQVALPSDGDLLGTEKCINLLSSPRTPSSTSHQRFPCPGACVSGNHSPEWVSCPGLGTTFVSPSAVAGVLW